MSLQTAPRTSPSPAKPHFYVCSVRLQSQPLRGLARKSYFRELHGRDVGGGQRIPHWVAKPRSKSEDHQTTHARMLRPVESLGQSKSLFNAVREGGSWPIASPPISHRSNLTYAKNNPHTTHRIGTEKAKLGPKCNKSVDAANTPQNANTIRHHHQLPRPSDIPARLPAYSPTSCKLQTASCCGA